MKTGARRSGRVEFGCELEETSKVRWGISAEKREDETAQVKNNTKTHLEPARSLVERSEVVKFAYAIRETEA